MLKPIKIHKFSIHFSFLVLISVSLFFDFQLRLLAVYLLAAIHELCHVAAAHAMGIRTEEVEILPFGVCARMEGSMIRDCDKEILIALAGPLSNLVMALFFYALFLYGKLPWETAWFLTLANLCMMLMNLVPALPLDGGRVLKAFLVTKLGYIRAYHLSVAISRGVIIFLLAVGIGVLFYTKFNFSLLLIGSFLFVNTLTESRAGKMVFMRELLFSREKLEKNGIEKASVITIMYNRPARLVLKQLSYHRYYLVQVIDEKMDVMGTLTETRLIEKLIEKGIRSTAENLLR